MTLASAIEPSQREILVGFGHRYAVFGPAAGLPQQLHFHPDADLEKLPQIADEADAAEARIVQTLQVYGMKRLASASPEADVELLDEGGHRL